MPGESYDDAGVRGQGDALSAVVRHLTPTFDLAVGVEVLTTFGQYASVLKLTDDLALALCTDGVGSKTIVASMLDRYDTIGFDCIAMNVNDIICVGARPIAMVDYLGVNTLDPRRTDEILRGLGNAAKEAGISIPGGELAQLPEVIGSDGSSAGDERSFDLVGACVGIVRPERLILGRSIEPGNAIVGVRSSGLHSNGFTLARRVLLQEAGYKLTDEIPRLGCTLGEELLRPTDIYVRAALDLWDAGIDTRGLAHITGDGVVNLCRLQAEVGYEFVDWPAPPEIFGLIQEAGAIDAAEMFRVFNMGIGLVAIVPEDQADAAVARLATRGYEGLRLGEVTADAGTVRIEPYELVGSMAGGESFIRHE